MQLEHEQERDDAGVGLGEVAEVVVRRDLAGENGVLLAHAVLDEGVADAADQGGAAGRGDRARYGPARAHVVEDGAAGALPQHHLGEERRDEVAGDELARVVDEEAAVGVPVVGDAEIGALCARLRDDERTVLLEERVRLVVRERPVRLEVAADDLDLRQALEDGRQHRRRPSRSPRRRRSAAARSRRRRRTRAPCRRSPARRRARLISPRFVTGPKPACAPARTSSRPESPPTGSAPPRTIFIPVYCFGLCEAVTQIPPSSPSSPTA